MTDDDVYGDTVGMTTCICPACSTWPPWYSDMTKLVTFQWWHHPMPLRPRVMWWRHVIMIDVWRFSVRFWRW